MMDNKQFLQYYDLEVDINTYPTDDIIKYLQDYVLGTDGGLRYLQLDLAERLAAIRKIYFMTLRKYGKLLGTVGFIRRQVRFRRKYLNTYYIRYFLIRFIAIMRIFKGKRVVLSKDR